eukprot:6133875-Alexandrium_andersonii.AAC.1
MPLRLWAPLPRGRLGAGVAREAGVGGRAVVLRSQDVALCARAGGGPGEEAARAALGQGRGTAEDGPRAGQGDGVPRRRGAHLARQVGPR